MKKYILILALVAVPLFGAPTCFNPGPAKVPAVVAATPTLPFFGCAEPGALRPDDSEVGDYLVVKFAGLTAEDRTRAVSVLIYDKIVCPAGAQSELCKDRAGQWVDFPGAELAPFEVLYWPGTGTTYPTSGAYRVTVTPDQWGLWTIPVPENIGPVTAAFRFNGRATPDGWRGTPITTCRSRTLPAGIEYWCHDRSRETDPGVCTDMAWGGDSPQPGFVGSPAGIWFLGEGPTYDGSVITFGPSRGAFLLEDEFDW